MRQTATKAWAALIIGAAFDAALTAQSYMADGHVTSPEWIAIGIAGFGTLATSLGVYRTTNRPKTMAITRVGRSFPSDPPDVVDD